MVIVGEKLSNKGDHQKKVYCIWLVMWSWCQLLRWPAPYKIKWLSLGWLIMWLGERGAQPNVGLNVTWTFYIVHQDQAGCLSALFLSLPEDGPPTKLYLVKILDKECFDTMQVNFFIIDFFRFLSWVYTFPNLTLYCLNHCLVGSNIAPF